MGKMHWYKRDPNAALGGMMGLTLEERGAYNTVLDLIYSRDDNLPDDDHFIAGWCQVDVRTWKRIKAKLIEKGKLERSGGLLRNFRATSEIHRRVEIIQLRQDAGREGGLKSGAVRNKNNGLAEANGEAFAEANDEAKSNRYKKEEIRKERKSARDPSPFEEWEQKLLAVEGVQGSGLAISSMHPITALQQEGYSLTGEIIPLLKADIAAAQAKGRLNRLSWATIAKKVREARTPATGQQAPSAPSEINWHTRLEYGRKFRQWHPTWGPIPNEPGCMVPPELLNPNDGFGWAQWEMAS
jgi:uncharacterized protein YdaU (DUF1376 family)